MVIDMNFLKPKNPKWTKQGKTVSMTDLQADKLDVGKASPTSKKVLKKGKLTDKMFEDAAGVPLTDMDKLSDFSNFMTSFKKKGY